MEKRQLVLSAQEIRGGVSYVCVEDDVTGHCQTLVDIVESVQGKEKRLTALKVV